MAARGGASACVRGATASSRARLLPLLMRSRTARVRFVRVSALAALQIAMGLALERDGLVDRAVTTTATAAATAVAWGDCSEEPTDPHLGLILPRLPAPPLPPGGGAATPLLDAAGVAAVDTASRALLFLCGVLPAFALCFLLSTRWTSQLLAKAVSPASSSPPPTAHAAPGPSLGSPVLALSAALHRAALLALLNAAVLALDFVPLLGRPAALVLCSFVVAATAFDAAAGVGAGVGMGAQADVYERHAPFLVGFGALTSIVLFAASAHSLLVGAGLYAMLHPLLALAAAEAAPELAAAPAGPRIPLLAPFRAAIWLVVKGVHWALAARAKG